jgi:hypothetical protein
MKKLVLKRDENIISRININNSVSVSKFTDDTNDVVHSVLEGMCATIFFLVNGERTVNVIIGEISLIYTEASPSLILIMIKELFRKGIVKIK